MLSRAVLYSRSKEKREHGIAFKILPNIQLHIDQGQLENILKTCIIPLYIYSSQTVLEELLQIFLNHFIQPNIFWNIFLNRHPSSSFPFFPLYIWQHFWKMFYRYSFPFISLGTYLATFLEDHPWFFLPGPWYSGQTDCNFKLYFS